MIYQCYTLNRVEIPTREAMKLEVGTFITMSKTFRIPMDTDMEEEYKKERGKNRAGEFNIFHTSYGLKTGDLIIMYQMREDIVYGFYKRGDEKSEWMENLVDGMTWGENSKYCCREEEWAVENGIEVKPMKVMYRDSDGALEVLEE